TAAHEDDVGRHDIRRGALVPVAVFPVPVLDAPLDADRPALREEFRERLGALAPERDVVPIGPLLALAGAVHVPLGGREPHGEHGLVALGVAELGIGSEVSDENYLVETFGHDFLCACGPRALGGCGFSFSRTGCLGVSSAPGAPRTIRPRCDAFNR